MVIWNGYVLKLNYIYRNTINKDNDALDQTHSEALVFYLGMGCCEAAGLGEEEGEEGSVILFNNESGWNHETVIQISQTSFHLNENAS